MATISGTLAPIVEAEDDTEFGSLDVALCGYGYQSPCVTGENVIDCLTAIEVQPDSEGNFSIEVPGNDTITPPTTYYTVTFRNPNGDILQCNAYMFLGQTDYDLANTPPFVPDLPTAPILPPMFGNMLLTLAFKNILHFDGSRHLTWKTTLTADVTASTLSGCAPGYIYTFIVIQDAVGGHTFTWPPNTLNATWINPDPNGVTIQAFICDSDGTLRAIAPSTLYTP